MTHHSLSEKLPPPVGETKGVHPLQILLQSRICVRITVAELEIPKFDHTELEQNIYYFFT